MKDKVVVIASNFGLGPVGKLASVLTADGNEFEWYATGPKFDIGIFESNKFKEVRWTEENDEMIKFVNENNIKYALVILKNKYARLLKKIGLKVIYVDSLPFMWTEEDAKMGKIPYDVDIYCAQKSIKLSEKSQNIFKRVHNLKWINPIIPIEKNKNINNANSINNNIIINVGGLHSPVGNGNEYIETIIKPLIECLKLKYKNKYLIITSGNQARESLKEMLKEYNVEVKTYSQQMFIQEVQKSFLFCTSPGLTTLLEISNMKKKTIILPPQNLSQFYNFEYAKKILYIYKIIDWNSPKLTLENFENINKTEGEIVEEIYNSIRELQITYKKDDTQKKYIMNILNEEFFYNDNYVEQKENGAQEVINYLKEMIRE